MHSWDCHTTIVVQPFSKPPQTFAYIQMYSHSIFTVLLGCQLCGVRRTVDESQTAWKSCERQSHDKEEKKDKGNSMSSALRTDGREAGGRARGMGPYLPWSLKSGPWPPCWVVVVGGGGVWGKEQTCWKLCTFQCAVREGPTHPWNH